MIANLDSENPIEDHFFLWFVFVGKGRMVRGILFSSAVLASDKI